MMDILRFLKNTWKRIVVYVLLGLAAGVVYSLLAPKWYTAEVALLPAAASKGGSGMSLSGAAAALGMPDLPLDLGGSVEVDRMDAILRSRSVTDDTIRKFGLMARYRAKYLEDARESLWKHCATKIEKKSQLLTLTCEDTSPALAQSIVGFMSDDANQVARRVSTSSASEERRFLETRVAQARLDFDNASQKLRNFQEQYRIVSLPEQAKAIVTSVATLRAELIDKQMQLAFVQGFSSNDEATTSQLQRQVSVIQSKLKSLEEPRSRVSADSDAGAKAGAPESHPTISGLFPPAMEVPSLQYQLERLVRDQKIQDALFALLTQRYEIARISEARDTPTFEMLDKPVLPNRISRPRKITASLVGVSIGLLVGMIASLIGMLRQTRE